MCLTPIIGLPEPRWALGACGAKSDSRLGPEVRVKAARRLRDAEAWRDMCIGGTGKPEGRATSPGQPGPCTVLRAPQCHTVGGKGAELSPPPAAGNKALTSWAVRGSPFLLPTAHGEGALLPLSERKKLKFRELSDPLGSCGYWGVWQTPPSPAGEESAT